MEFYRFRSRDVSFCTLALQGRAGYQFVVI
jgi:hypothetical protein